MPGLAAAHPVLSENHDRVIRVVLQPERVIVHYLLEVDELRAARDLAGLSEEERSKIRSRQQLHETYLDYMAKVLANNLQLKLADKSLGVEIGPKTITATDHLACKFQFQFPFTDMPPGLLDLQFREGNFEEDDFSKLDLAVEQGEDAHCRLIQFPSEELRKKVFMDRAPGDMQKLRTLRLSFVPKDLQHNAPIEKDSKPEVKKDHGEESLFHLLLDDKNNRWFLFLLAMMFGAAHALTPGHGKTLAAAYLVAEKGTIGHALLLGLSTTVSHTAAVFLLAILLPWLFPDTGSKQVESVLGFAGGLIIAGLGFWLFLKRVLNQADHHHGPMSGHSHLPDGSVVFHEPAPGIRGILLLGLAGGMIPCWDAVAMLLFAISAGMLTWAVPLLVAFSIGLASVLVIVGVLVVKARDAIGKSGLKADWMDRASRVLPIFSAAVVTLIGFWLCSESLK